MLRSEVNTPENERAIMEAARNDGDTMHHDSLNSFFEHDQWWVSCAACGAAWSVNDYIRLPERTERLGFEEVSHGDESCLRDDKTEGDNDESE